MVGRVWGGRPEALYAPPMIDAAKIGLGVAISTAIKSKT
jgi:hypothetical protein